MDKFKLGEMEQKFADLIWVHEPIKSGELSALCEGEFNWKKSTTYTMLKRLCDREIFQNKSMIVSSLIKKEDFHALQGKEFIDESFGGSLPQFFTAFSRQNKFSKTDIAELRKLINECEVE